MVRIHAQTILPATFQRTERSRRREPTPTMAPVIVCVVDTGMPKWAAPKSVTAPAASAANPPIGCSPRDSRSHGVDDAPAAREGAETDGGMGDQDDPKRDEQLARWHR